jgi:endonuclease G, mitochondrial
MRFIRLGLLALALAACATPSPAPAPASAPTASSVPPIIERDAAAAPDLAEWGLEESECLDFYFDSAPPIVISQHDFGTLHEVCFTHYVALHSTGTRGALWSAMFLTRELSDAGDCITRGDFDFVIHPNLTREDSASDSDYAGHGTDWHKGHMVPVDDMPSDATQEETFFYSNAVPQAAALNRSAWARLENRVHNLAQDVDDGLYVVTGVVYANQTVRRLNQRVGIPTHVFKAVYDPAGERARAFIARNTASATISQISLGNLDAEYGVVAFPGLQESVRGADEEWELPSFERRECDV